MFFFILIIFRNYISSFSLVGLWTIRLFVQVHSIGYNFAFARKWYDNHNCHNKPQIENEAGVWMTSCPEAMVPRIWRFWKRVSLKLTVGQAGRQLSLYHWGIENWVLCHGVESWKVDFGLSAIQADSWVPTMVLRSWVKTMVLRSWGPTGQLGVWLA